ncbi:hypothetical protein SBOR_8756 [Sclerotinia borealis F-4128]|uniref:Uncharacterized protein n=1 Tax=Sclerotinia borealis (strain F-4128) TaxID=1432307 RepID=W9C7M5_SCLBF|nr:hypothetical protein SBOR_8756 [Sclerotinia borealis F-4128]
MLSLTRRQSHRAYSTLIFHVSQSITFGTDFSVALSGKIKYYRPVATRTGTLAGLLAITLLLIALLEYSCHVIPKHSGFGSTAATLANITRSKLDERDDSPSRERIARSESISIALTASTAISPVLTSAGSAAESTYLTSSIQSPESTNPSLTIPLTASGSSYLTPEGPLTISVSTAPITTHLTSSGSTVPAL